jgi:hypothetical protein
MERLQASGEGIDLRRRHATVFLSLAEEAERQLVSADRTPWLQRLDLELHNIRAALVWSIGDAGDPRSASAWWSSLRWYFYLRGNGKRVGCAASACYSGLPMLRRHQAGCVECWSSHQVKRRGARPR